MRLKPMQETLSAGTKTANFCAFKKSKKTMPLRSLALSIQRKFYAKTFQKQLGEQHEG